jgi:hypothetical protein
MDPFMGSGSTRIGALTDGFQFIGIEMDNGYFEIAKQRIQHFKKLKEMLDKQSFLIQSWPIFHKEEYYQIERWFHNLLFGLFFWFFFLPLLDSISLSNLNFKLESIND